MDTHFFEKILRLIIYIMLINVDKTMGAIVYHHRMGMKTCTVLLKNFSNWYFFVMCIHGITEAELNVT